MTLETIRSLVRSSSARTDKDALINSAINLALREIASRQFFQCLQRSATAELSANGSSVDLPDDCFHVIGVRVLNDTASYSILIKPKTWVLERYPFPGSLSPAKPKLAYIETNQLFVVPYADISYNIQFGFYKIPAELVSNNDEPEILNSESCITAFASAYVFRSLQMFREADQWMQEFERALHHLTVLDQRRFGVDMAFDQDGFGVTDVQGNMLEPYQDPFAGH